MQRHRMAVIGSIAVMPFPWGWETRSSVKVAPPIFGLRESQTGCQEILRASTRADARSSDQPSW